MVGSMPEPPIVQRPLRPRRPTRKVPSLPAISTGISNTPASSVSGSPSVSATSNVPDQSNPDSTFVHSQTDDRLNDLTPIRAHYLKKSLIQLQFNLELDAITSNTPNNISTLSYLGPPFIPPPKNAPPIELPFLRYVFRQFVLTFPFLVEAPKNFFPEKLQPFMISMLSRNLSPGSILDDDSEHVAQATRLKLLNKVERSLSILLVSGVKLVEPEQVVRLSQLDLSRLEILARKRLARERRLKDSFEVNIVCVRTVIDKGRVRNKAHDEFIIRTRRRGQPDIFVARRHGDFKTLANELRKAHPEEVIRPPPAKDRTYVAAPSIPAPGPPALYTSGTLTSPVGSGPGFQNAGSDASIPSPSNTGFSLNRLSREKNRLTLRAYLHSLLASSTTASSPVLRSFLISGPMTLTSSEVEDAQKREEADRTREDGRKKFAQEIAGRVEGLREAVKSVKGDLVGKDGLTYIFGTIKVTPNIKQLPPNYQAVIEWARISLASTVFHHFVASDEASESFATLKRIHGLMPYFMMKAALKISNPIGMIRTMLDLFLAQPFGGKSLLQRMFTSSLAEEVKALEDDIEVVKDKVDDPMICEKIRLFIYAPPEIQAFYKEESVVEKMNLITIVLRSSEQPVLSRPQMHRVAKSSRAHQAYLKQRRHLDDSDDDDGPQDEDAWLFEDLTLLAKLYSRLRDREQLIALIFEGVTAELLKDIITIFYAPLAQVYKAASIADSFGDLQTFINDLIRTVEQTEQLSQEDPHRTVQAFIDLIQRHEQMFYNFVHKVHSRGDGLFDNLMKWIELILAVMREGLGKPTSLDFLLPHTGRERQDILEEIDQVAAYHYKLKVAHEHRVRRRFGRMQGQHDADAEDQATAALVQSVVHDLSFGDLIQGDADEFAAEASHSEGSSSDESSEEETDDSDETSESEESSPRRSTAVARSHSIGHTLHTPKRPSLTPLPSRSKGSLDQNAASRPVSSGQLRTSRSLNFRPSRTKITPTAVPPIPTKHLTPNLPKSLQLSPVTGSRSSNRPPADTNSGDSKAGEPSCDKQLPRSPAKRKKVVEQIKLKPPELHHIPQLLPVFVEMLTPQLQLRT